MLKRIIIPTTFIRKFSTKTTHPQSIKETRSITEYYLLSTLIFTSGCAGLGGIDGLCSSLTYNKYEKPLRMYSVFDNTMNTVTNIIVGMCLGSAVGIFWPISIPTAIFLYLQKDKNDKK